MTTQRFSERIVDAQVDGPALVPVVDPEALEAAHRAGVGAQISVSVAGKMDSEFSSLVELKALVQAVSHGFVVDLERPGSLRLEAYSIVVGR